MPSLIRDERLFFFLFYNFHREILELLFFLKGFYFAGSYDCKPEMLMKINI